MYIRVVNLKFSSKIDSDAMQALAKHEMINNLPDLSKLLSAKNPDLTIYVDSFQSGPPVFSDVNFRILGDDVDILRKLGSELELIINNAPDISHTKSEAGYSNTNIEFEFDSSNISLSVSYTHLTLPTICSV